MGVVRKQGILSLIAIYLGFVIGAINQYLYTNFLSQDLYGLTSIFRDVTLTFSIMATMGSLLTFHRFYPLFNHLLGRERNDLPALVLGVCIIGMSLMVAILIGFKDVVTNHFSENSPLFVEKYYLIIPLFISFTLCILFEAFAFMLKRTVSINLVKEIGFRLFQTAIIICYYFGWIDIDTFFILFSLMYVPSVIIMGWIVFARQGIKLNFKISKLTTRIKKVIFGYTSFHFSGAILAVLPTAVNSVLIGSISKNGLADVGIYNLAKFLISVLEAPQRGINGINTAVLSEAFRKRDFVTIGRLYKKTSLNLLIIGIALFTLIYSNIELVNHLIEGKDYSFVAKLFLVLGLTKLFELSMGLNGTIMYLSKYWKVEFYTNAAIILLSIPINYYFIKHQPLLGAALGESLMMILFCTLRWFWVKKLLHLKPYSSKTLLMLFVGIIGFAITYFIPTTHNLFIDLVIKSTIFVLYYFGAIWYIRPSEDLHDLLEKGLKRIRKK